MIASKSASKHTRSRSSLIQAHFSFRLRKSDAKQTRCTLLGSDKGRTGGSAVDDASERRDLENATRTFIDGHPIKAQDSFKLTSSLTASLLPLAFAQSRKDIRERKEGFEMPADFTPFAVRTQRLLPLDIAYARDDIRRRHEDFECRDGPCTPSSSSQPFGGEGQPGSTSHLPSLPPSSPLAQAAFASCPSFRAADSTLSIYSQTSRSWIDLSVVDPASLVEDSWSYDSLVAAYSDESDYSQDLGDAGEAPKSFPSGTSSCSFDEESFLRMAETYVGW